MADDFSTPPSHALSDLKDTLGPKGWSDDPTDLSPHCQDWRGNFQGSTPLLLKPSNTEEVSAIARTCYANGIAMTPQGGNTGLVNGGIPHGEVLISMQRMPRFREVDAFNNSLTVEAGSTLSGVHEEADKVNRFFPLSLGSQGTATIGGLISTNAGGVAVLRYGMMRDLILGLEVVTANGDVWNGLSGLRKDNTGYDLKHLFCGAEGTLGIVTAATLKLFPKPQTATAWLCVSSPEKAVQLLALIRDCVGDTVTSFEILPRNGVELTAQEIDGARDPLPSDAQWRVLCEVSMATSDAAQSMLEAALERAFEAELIEDGTIAASLKQTQDFWTFRESLPLVKRAFLTSVNHDVSVPVSKVPEFLHRTESILSDRFPGIEIFAFGHIGDGNIHYGVAERAEKDRSALFKNRHCVTKTVHDIVSELGGSISAEHGVGLLKRDELETRKSDVSLHMMRSIKASLDPKYLFNPGRVVRL